VVQIHFPPAASLRTISPAVGHVRWRRRAAQADVTPSPGRSTTVNARAASLDYAAAPEELEGFANEDHRSARVHRDNRVAPAVGGCALAGLSAAPKGRRRSSIAAASRPRGPGPEARGQNHTLEAAPKGTNPMYRLPGWRRLDPIRDTLNDGGLDAEIPAGCHRFTHRRVDLIALHIDHLFAWRAGERGGRCAEHRRAESRGRRRFDWRRSAPAP
jgi:hypothetical protein